MTEVAKNWVVKVGRGFCRIMIVVFALAVVGALIPAIPVIGSVGPLLIAPFASWIVLLSLVGAGVYLWQWRRGGGRSVLVLGAIVSFAALGTASIEACQIAAARAHGIAIDIARTLWAGPVSHTSAAPVVLSYSADAAGPLRIVAYKPAAKAGVATPVLVYVHGGGWGGGTIFDREADWRWFADRGYLVLSVEYTLSSKTRHTWNTAVPQIGCALNWINANAANLGGAPDQLALIGESAGGNLVLNASYLAAAGKLNPSCPGVLPHIAAVIAPYPVIDAAAMFWNKDLIAGPFGRMMTVNYTGGALGDFPERYAAISSGTHITPAAPPTLLFPGLADHLLPSTVAVGFVERAKAAGIDAQLVAYPYGEHSFDQSEGSIGSQLVRQASLRFLAEHKLAPR